MIFAVDGGPDWTTKSCTNAMFLARFWEDENLDMLIAASYAPGFSRYNPIEHAWSPCSKYLAGVSLEMPSYQASTRKGGEGKETV